jgi:hypothetical protein
LADAAIIRSEALDNDAMKILVRGHHAHWNIYFEWQDEHVRRCREALVVARMTNDRNCSGIPETGSAPRSSACSGTPTHWKKGRILLKNGLGMAPVGSFSTSGITQTH